MLTRFELNFKKYDILTTWVNDSACESYLVHRRLLYHFQKFTRSTLWIFAIFIKSINWTQ
eukprot:UN24295